MRTIHLHGMLSKYAKSVDLEVDTASEAVRALCVNFPGMREDIEAGQWSIVRGKSVDDGLSLDEDQVAAFKLGKADLHIIPVIAGAKNNGGALKLLLGAALIAVSFGFATALASPILGIQGAMTYGGAIGMAGASMALAGVSALLAPESKSKEEERSFTFNGPQGSVRQGVGVPIVYGELIVGSVMISGGFDVDQLKPL